MLRPFLKAAAVASLLCVAIVPASVSAQDLQPEAVVHAGSDKRPYGGYANDYADLAYQQSANAYSAYASDNAYYAYVYAYYGAAYGDWAGQRVSWSWTHLFGGTTRKEAYASYYENRNLQATYDYYAYYYAYLAYSESGQTGWYDASLSAYYAWYYASVDLSY